jgi:hypothetical protein
VTDELDTELRRLVGELADAAPSPHDWSRVSLHPTTAPPNRTPVYLAIAATAIVVVAGIATLAVVTTTTDGEPAPGNPTPPPLRTEPPVSDPSSVTDPTTLPTVPTAADDVSYRNPPPLYTPEPFASVEVPEDSTGLLPQVAVMEDGVVVVDRDGEEAIVIADDPALGTRRVQLDAVPYAITAGPDDVLYGLVVAANDNVQVVAIPLSGPRRGEVVASADADATTFVELPVASVGHGPDGVTDRTRNTGEVLLGYVDVSGAPIESTQNWPDYGSAVGDGKAWDFEVERHPGWREPFTDDSGAAPTIGGLGVYWTWIGADAGGGGDFGTPSMPVIGVLHDDGEVAWWRLPEEWQVVASDVWGTLLARRLDDARIEFARFDPTATPLGNPADTTTTTTTTTTTPRPEPEWPGQLDVDTNTGRVSAPGFNRFVEMERPEWSRDPRETARMLVEPVMEPERLEVSSPRADGGRTVVTATISNFMDDSVFAVRYEFTFVTGDDGLLGFERGQWLQRCQPGRGHQDFSRELCV